jgi:hypothetical protein
MYDFAAGQSSVWPQIATGHAVARQLTENMADGVSNFSSVLKGRDHGVARWLKKG